MATTFSVQAMAFAKSAANRGPDMIDGGLPQTGSPTFKKGAVLIMSSGNGIEASADPTSIAGVAAEQATFIQSGTFDASTKLYQNGVNANTPTYKASQENIFEISYSGVLAATDLGAGYGIAKDSTTGFWYLDDTDTSNKRMVIVGLPNDPGRGTIGDTYARVNAQFIQSATIWD